MEGLLALGLDSRQTPAPCHLIRDGRRGLDAAENKEKRWRQLFRSSVDFDKVNVVQRKAHSTDFAFGSLTRHLRVVSPPLKPHIVGHNGCSPRFGDRIQWSIFKCWLWRAGPLRLQGPSHLVRDGRRGLDAGIKRSDASFCGRAASLRLGWKSRSPRLLRPGSGRSGFCML